MKKIELFGRDYLHCHPTMERDLKVDQETHVIVDKNEWEATYNFFNNNPDMIAEFMEFAGIKKREGHVPAKGDFKTRLLAERAQLSEKIKKLDSFLSSDKSNTIDQIQLALLGIQLPAMKTYLRCLDERIGRL